MNTADRVLYTGRTHTTGGRDGAAHSDDGRLDIRLSVPGGNGTGSNPEQLLAAGWSACFLGAIGQITRARGMQMPKDAAVDTEIDLLAGDDGFRLTARLFVSLPGLEREAAESLIRSAHATCPYSKAVRGNIDATVRLA